VEVRLARTDFDDLYRAHYNQILRFAERRVDAETARDVASECFTIAWRRFDPERPHELAWLYQVARNVIGNTYRRQARELELLDALKRERPATDDGGIDIVAALERLPKKEREALQLTYWEGLGAADVGIVVGCSEQAAWKRISRAKQQLRAILEPLTTASGQEEQTHV
jgi:RNA polymerase sigma factor (sigma-70 family)